MKLMAATLGVILAIDAYVLFALESRGTCMGGTMLILPAIYFGGASLALSLAMIIARWFTPNRFSLRGVHRSMAFALVFIQLLAVREVGEMMINSDVEKAKNYCDFIINQIQKNAEGQYPQKIDLKSFKRPVPRMIRYRFNYRPSEDRGSYVMSFAWDFEYMWIYETTREKWYFSS
ncbi:MAG: hypothetical protein PF795_13400 [Kiritimatiellae bacterium]|jgi:hypothetical protein|nr:hypothetical protein [Kiritimatiellia bacterium]